MTDYLLELTARAYATHFWFHGFRAFVTPVLRDLAGGRRDLSMVDCGCGTGHNLDLLAPYGRATGFDFSPTGVVVSAEGGYGVVRADIARIPFQSDTFDLATSFDVLACVDDDVAAVREMARVVRPGGGVVLTLAALDILGADHGELWNEYRRYTRRSARALVEGAGLKVERLSYLFGSLFPLMLAVRLGQRALRPFRTAAVDADIAVPAAPINTILTWVLRAEGALITRVPMPIGSSLLVVARRPS